MLRGRRSAASTVIRPGDRQGSGWATTVFAFYGAVPASFTGSPTSGRPAHRQQGDVVHRGPGPDKLLHDLLRDRLGMSCAHGAAQPLQPDVDRLIPTLDKTVGVKEKHTAGRHVETYLFSRDVWHRPKWRPWWHGARAAAAPGAASTGGR